VGRREWDLEIGGLTVRVRESGLPDGVPVMHFHGTPGSRLELAWADVIVAMSGVRLVAFDRPGYGGSTPAPFGLEAVARIALRVADQLGLGAFRTSGLSGGGPFALATAVVGRERVLAVGVSSGAAPFQLVPELLAGLSPDDRQALARLPDDPVGAAAGFERGFDLRAALCDRQALVEAFGPLLSPSDRRIFEDPMFGEALLDDLREAMRQGARGCAWDNVAWIGPWDVDPTGLACPVLLWYGDEDRMAPPPHGYWLRDHIPTARLTIRGGEGHFGIMAHLRQMLDELIQA